MNVAIEAAQASRFDPSREDDFLDRLLRQYSFALLIGFAIVVGTGSYLGERIVCTVDPVYTRSSVFTKYIENACYLNNTYAISEPGKPHAPRRNVTYYQWSMFIVIVATVLLLVPNFIWRTIAPSYREFPLISRNYSLILDGKQQKELIRRATLVMRNVIANSGQSRALAHSYMCMKLVTIVVIVLELLLFRFVLAESNIFRLMTSPSPYNSIGSKFPLLVKCAFTVPVQGQTTGATVTADCLLPNNILLYYWFTFCLYWFLFLLVLALGGFALWLRKLFVRRARCAYIANRLHVPVDVGHLNAFVDMIGVDGTFMLHMTSKNGSDLFCSMLTENLYNLYLQAKLDFKD